MSKRFHAGLRITIDGHHYTGKSLLMAALVAFLEDCGMPAESMVQLRDDSFDSRVSGQAAIDRLKHAIADGLWKDNKLVFLERATPKAYITDPERIADMNVIWNAMPNLSEHPIPRTPCFGLPTRQVVFEMTNQPSKGDRVAESMLSMLRFAGVMEAMKSSLPPGVDVPEDLLDWLKRAGVDFEFQDHPGQPNISALQNPYRFWQAVSEGASVLNTPNPCAELTASLQRRGFRDFFDEHEITNFNVVDRGRSGALYDEAREAIELDNGNQVMMTVAVRRLDGAPVEEVAYEALRDCLFAYDPFIMVVRKLKDIRPEENAPQQLSGFLTPENAEQIILRRYAKRWEQEESFTEGFRLPTKLQQEKIKQAVIFMLKDPKMIPVLRNYRITWVQDLVPEEAVAKLEVGFTRWDGHSLAFTEGQRLAATVQAALPTIRVSYKLRNASLSGSHQPSAYPMYPRGMNPNIYHVDDAPFFKPEELGADIKGVRLVQSAVRPKMTEITIHMGDNTWMSATLERDHPKFDEFLRTLRNCGYTVTSTKHMEQGLERARAGMVTSAAEGLETFDPLKKVRRLAELRAHMTEPTPLYDGSAHQRLTRAARDAAASLNETFGGVTPPVPTPSDPAFKAHVESVLNPSVANNLTKVSEFNTDMSKHLPPQDQ